MPARRRPPGVRLGLDRRSGPVGSAFLVDVADDILAIDCDSADRVEVQAWSMTRSRARLYDAPSASIAGSMTWRSPGHSLASSYARTSRRTRWRQLHYVVTPNRQGTFPLECHAFGVTRRLSHDDATAVALTSQRR